MTSNLPKVTKLAEPVKGLGLHPYFLNYYVTCPFKALITSRNTWVAQSVECPTLGFRSGGDLRDMRPSQASDS